MTYWKQNINISSKRSTSFWDTWHIFF